MCPYFISMLRRNMQHNLKKSQKITKTEETGIYCYFFTIYLIKLFKFFFPFLLVISCDFVLVFFAGHRSMAATLLLQKMVALATDVNFPWLINFFDRDHSPRHKDRNSKHYQEKHKHSEGHKSRHSSHEYKHHLSHRY